MREYDPAEEFLVENVELDDEPDLSLIFEDDWVSSRERASAPEPAAEPAPAAESSPTPPAPEAAAPEAREADWQFEDFPKVAEPVEEVEPPAHPDQHENWREKFTTAQSAEEPEESESSAGLRGKLGEKIRAARGESRSKEEAPASTEGVAPPSFEISDESEKSWTGKLVASVRTALSKDEAEPAEQAGLDIAPPPSGMLGSLRARLTGETALAAAVAQDQRSGFEDLLRPLSGPNLQVLQAQVAAEEPVFSQLKRAHKAAEARAHIAFYLGLIPIIAFFAITGTSYLSETLAQATLPQWYIELGGRVSAVDPEQWREAGRVGLFALGMLVPFAALFVWVESIRRLLSGVGTRRVSDVLMGLAGFAIAFLILLYLSKAMIISTLIWLIAYLVISKVYSLWHRG